MDDIEQNPPSNDHESQVPALVDLQDQNIHIANASGIQFCVVGCGHGELNSIYDAIKASRKRIDLLIICGDVQTIRNQPDLNNINMPEKYKRLGDFHEYYSGKRTAPVLTVFIGGNHEASAYLWELYYGGWVAPNMYFLGYSNVLRFGGLRIASISGIYKMGDYTRAYDEMPPFSPGALRSIYHIRQREVFKMSLIKNNIDVFVSHDWPRHIAFFGDTAGLIRQKEFFAADIASGELGAAALQHLLHLHVPRYWFAAHLHVKFAALVPDLGADSLHKPKRDDKNLDFLGFSHLPDFVRAASVANGSTFRKNPVISLDDCITCQENLKNAAENSVREDVEKESEIVDSSSKNIRRVTRFLALDKVLPRRRFMQYLQIESEKPECCGEIKTAPPALEFDHEWLAIVRATAQAMPLRQTVFEAQIVPLSSWDSKLEESREWIKQNVADFRVPLNFAKTSPEHDSKLLTGFSRVSNSIHAMRLHFNPQTQEYCNLLGIPNEVCEKGLKLEDYDADEENKN